MVTPMRRLVSGLVIALMLVGAFVLGNTVMTGSAQDPVVFPDRPVFEQIIPDSATEEERLLAGIYARVSPSVVSINVVSTLPTVDTFETPEEEEEGFVEATGTGFVIDAQGHIVTNAHVVHGASQIEVNLFDGRIVRAELVGNDLDSDIAVIQINVPAETLTPIAFGDSDSLFIGQEVVAIGSPFNQPWTMTTGIVSALGRTIRGLNQFSIGAVIQTDAAINPGNSGGPLLNLRGEVIGVNSQIISQSRSSSGIGFAIPSNLVSVVAQELMRDGEMDYSFLGISGGDVFLDLIELLELPNNAAGIVIGRVEPSSPASRAGLQNPSDYETVNGLDIPRSVDIITHINGTPLRGMPDLISYLARETQPGQTVTLTIVRDGRETLNLEVTLQARPSR